VTGAQIAVDGGYLVADRFRDAETGSRTRNSMRISRTTAGGRPREVSAIRSKCDGLEERRGMWMAGVKGQKRSMRLEASRIGVA
jgi:hypothetical protein